MNGADERGRERRERDLKPTVMAPVPRRAAPAERKQAVHFAPCARRAVTHRRKVWQDADIPENDREDEIAGDRPEIPNKGAAPLRPDLHAGRIGREPVEIKRPSKMEDREQPGDRYGEKRHGFGEAADRGAPVLPGEDEQRRDQRAGIADADPPDIVRDGVAPHDAGVDAPDADAGGEEFVDADEGRDQPHRAEHESDPPAQTRRPQKRRANEIGHGAVVERSREDRGFSARRAGGEGRGAAHAFDPLGSAFRTRAR